MEQKSLSNQLYSLYNNLACRYGDCMCFPSDGFAVNELMEKYKLDFTHVELCNIGEIDIATGKVTPHDPIRIPWDETKLPVTQSTPISATEL